MTDTLTTPEHWQQIKLLETHALSVGFSISIESHSEMFFKLSGPYTLTFKTAEECNAFLLGFEKGKFYSQFKNGGEKC